jgi:hypothetical protein
VRGSKLIGGFIFMAEIVNDKGSVVETSTGIETGGVAVEKTYTESEVQALLQREGDRRVSSALKKQQKEFERQTAEADKLRDMDESQRKEYEYTQRLQELENKIEDGELLEVVTCKNCKYLEYSDCYGECSKGFKGIVSPNTYCENGERKENK